MSLKVAFFGVTLYLCPALTWLVLKVSVYGCLDPSLYPDVLVLTIISNTSHFKSSTYRQVEINLLGRLKMTLNVKNYPPNILIIRILIRRWPEARSPKDMISFLLRSIHRVPCTVHIPDNNRVRERMSLHPAEVWSWWKLITRCSWHVMLTLKVLWELCGDGEWAFLGQCGLIRRKVGKVRDTTER